MRPALVEPAWPKRKAAAMLMMSPTKVSTGGDAGQRQSMNDVIKKPAAAAAKGAGPGHSSF
jgi:hypothetical protein